MYDYFDKELLTVDEVSELLCLGKNTVYELLRSGELEGIRFGRIWRIPKDSIKKLINQKKIRREI